MKIFLSHSSKDKELAKALASFLESINNEIEVICSSEKGTIKPGQNFIEVLLKELQESDAFIPLLSPHYYESRFCMIELGFSCACLYNRRGGEKTYIYPLAVAPVRKEEALAETPLAFLQVASLDDMQDMRKYIESLSFSQKLLCPSGLNRHLSHFIETITEIEIANLDIAAKAKFLVCKSGNVPGEDGDYLSYTSQENSYTVRFNAKPFPDSANYPDFLSFVFKYIDKIDLFALAKNSEGARLHFDIENNTGSLSKINVEIKYRDIKDILYRETIPLTCGTTKVDIKLKEMQYAALESVSEICFVLPPSAYLKDQGAFTISNVKISAG